MTKGEQVQGQRIVLQGVDTALHMNIWHMNIWHMK